MGTQQLLLLVLTVIIVGISITLAVTMFNHHFFNENKQAMLTELANYKSILMQYWKTSTNMGGAGQTLSNVTIDKIAPYLGFSYLNPYNMQSENGELRVISASGTEVVLMGLGIATKNNVRPLITYKVNLTNGYSQSTVGSAVSF